MEQTAFRGFVWTSACLCSIALTRAILLNLTRIFAHVRSAWLLVFVALFIGSAVAASPKVVSINTGSSNPTRANVSVGWQVVFDQSVTGVDSGDFSLVQSGGATGAGISSVTGSGTTWTVVVTTGSGTAGSLQLNLVDNDTIINSGGEKLGGTGSGNGNFSGQAYTLSTSACVPPPNTPIGITLTCQCDSFGRTNLNPSPMFGGSNWIVSTSDTTGTVPYINSTSKYLRLTENTGNNAKAATVPGFFPAAGNYISVELKLYAYKGSGADGMAVILSDYTVAPVPGAYGGSLGYAQKTSGGNANGFAGGWIGVGLDEFGNYSQSNEGRNGGVGFITDGVAVRGSGSGLNGYAYLAGTASSLNPGVDNASATSPSYGHYYQVIVDARNAAAGKTYVAVNRDTAGTGATYSSIVPSFDAFAAAIAKGTTQAAVPANWQISLTGSTGGQNNIHELDELRVCAQYQVPPDGGSAGGFSAIDDAYPSVIQNFLTGHIYMKLVNTPFQLKVAALSNSQILTTYAASATKNVTIKLVDNSDGLCGTDSGRVTACATSACNGKTAVSGGSQTLAYKSADKGIKTTSAFTLTKAYSNLVAVMTDGTTTACSVDSFSVRPTLISSVSSSATNTALTGTPAFKAGTDTFTMTATINALGYTGAPQIDTTAMTVLPSGTGAVAGAFTPSSFNAATDGVSTSTATGVFKYSEAGSFRFLGYNPATDSTSVRGIYDSTWSAVDSSPTKGDCTANSYSNTKGSDGKYGCLFGFYDSGTGGPNSAVFGRFIPDHFSLLGGAVMPACRDATKKATAPSIATPFSYMGQPFGVAYRLQAQNGAGGVTANYDSARGFPTGAPVLSAEDQAATNQGCDLISRISGIGAGTWVNGVYAVNDANADNLPDATNATFSRPTTPGALTTSTCSSARAAAGGPFSLLDVGVSMSDSGATMSGMDMDAASIGTCTTCTARKIGTTAVLDGRLLLTNAYGSELLPLPVPAISQYWTSNGWVKNVSDSCSSMVLPTSTNAGFSFPTANNNLVAGEVVAQMWASTVSPVQTTQGNAALVLRHPTNSAQGPGLGNSGYVDVIGSVMAPTWLPSNTARACFGACGPRSPVIYMREMY